MPTGLYKYGRAQARTKLAIDTATIREGIEAALSQAKAHGGKALDTGKQIFEQMRTDPRILANLESLQGLGRTGVEHIADRAINPLTGGDILASAALPGLAGAGVGALTAGEDARAEGALAGAGLGALGGLGGLGIGRLAGGGARRQALGDALEAATAAASRGLGSEGLSDAVLKANLPSTGWDIGSGLVRSRGIDMLSKGMGTASGGGLGVAAGGLAGKALGDAQRREQSAAKIESDQLSDLGLLYGS